MPTAERDSFGHVLVAVRNFIAHDRYTGQFLVVAGSTHVSEDSDVAKEHPGAFAPARSYPLGGRPRERPTLSPGAAAFHEGRVPAAQRSTHTSTHPATTLSGPRWFLPKRFSEPAPALEGRFGSYQVRLQPTARRDMIEYVLGSTACDGKEVGGVLLGARPRSWIGIVEVTAAASGGRNAVRKKLSLTPDADFDQSQVNEYREHFDQAELGYWHSHVDGDGVASEADRRAPVWRAMGSVCRCTSS